MYLMVNIYLIYEHRGYNVLNMKIFKTELRSDETFFKYMKRMKENKCKTGVNLIERIGKEPVDEYKYWVIIEDEFPFDKIAKVHHLLIPKRVFMESTDMTKEEKEEMEYLIGNELPKKYDYILNKLDGRSRSFPDHFHIHLLEIKKTEYKEK